MTGVMDLKHILCEPMEVETTKPTMIMHPLDYYDDMQQTLQGQYQPETDHSNHSRFNNNHGSNSMCHRVSPQQRTHSEHYRTSPVLSLGYHYSQQPLHRYYHRDEVLIAPLTSSMSTNIIPSHSSSSSIYSATSSMTSALSPSTSSSASSLSSSSSSPITPTMLTPTSSSTISHDYQHQRRRHRSASTSQVHQRQQQHSPDTIPVVNQIQTRTPWTPHEDDLLQKGYEDGLSWAMISSTYLPHRSRGCCWGRFKTLQNKNLIDVKVQQQIRSAKLAWKTMEISKSMSTSSFRSSSLSSSRSSSSL